MSKQTILDRYTVLLKAYALQPDEKHLVAAAELSREMVQADMSLEAVSRVYVEALQCLAQERPDMTLPDTLSLVLPFLQQLMTAGDLAHRKRLASSKQMVESLRQSAAEYRAIFETTGTAMMIIEEDTTISLLNTESEKLYGYSREEIEGKRSWTEFVVPDDLERMKEYHRLRRVDPNLAPHNYEFRLMDGHGNIKNTLLFIDVIPGTSKSVASLLDVTELKLAEEALKRRATQLATVAEIGRQMATFLALDPLLERIVALIREAFGYRYVSLFLIDPAGEELVLRAGAGYEMEPAKAVHLKIGEEGICGWVAANGEPLVVGDVSQEPRYYPLDTLAATRSELALPVRLKDQIIGVLDMQSTELNAFDEEDIFVLQLLSDQVAVALENTRLFEAEQRRRQEAETLREAALTLTTSLERDEVVRRILIQLREVVPYDSASVQLLHGDQLEIIGTYGFPDPEKILGITFDLAAEDAPNGKVMHSRKHIILEDAPAGYDRFKQDSYSQHIHGWLGVPLLVGERAVGMLALDKHEPGFYTEEHAQLALAFAAQAAIAIENARLYAQAQQEIAERQRAEEEARTSETQKSSILETIPHAVIGLQERRIVFANPGVEAVFGWQPEELLGKTARLLYRSQEEYEEIGEHFYPMLAKQATYREEFPCRRKDGRDIVCLMNASRIGDSLQDRRIVVVYEDITARKRMEEALAHRLIALTQPAGEVGELQLTDIIDLELLQELQDRFAETYNVASVIFKPDGTPLTRPSNFSEFCHLIRSTSKGSKDCQASDAMLARQCNLGAPALSHCATFEGVLNGVVSIIVGGRHIANWGIGQGVMDRLDEDKVRRYAGEIGVDEKQLVSAARELPVMSREQVEKVVQFLDVIAQHIALLGLQNLQQARNITARQQSEKALREATDTLAAQNTRLAALQRVGQLLNSTLDVDVILDCLTDEALRVTHATHGQVLVVRKESGYFERHSLRGFSPEETGLARTVLLALDKGINGRVYATAQTVRVDDVQDEPDYFPLIPATRAELGVPIVREGKVLGNLDLQSPTVGAFRDVDLEYLLALADQAAIAIENARLFEETRQQARDLGLLYEIGQLLVSNLETTKILNQISRRCTEVFNADLTLVRLIVADRLVMKGSYFHDPADQEILEELLATYPLHVGEGIVGRVAASGQPAIHRAEENVAHLTTPGYVEYLHAREWVLVPMRSGKTVMGVLTLIRRSEKGPFLERDMILAQGIADQAAVAIENERLFQAEQEQRELAESLAEAAAAVGSTLDSDEVLDHILEQVARVVQGDVFNIMLLGGDTVRAVRWQGYKRLGIEEQIAGFTVPLAKYPNFTRMVESGKTVFISDTTAAPDWVMEAGQEWRRSYIGAPIQAGGETIGFLNADGTRAGQFSPADVQRLEAFAGHAAIAIQNAQLYQQSQELVARITRLYELSIQINETLSLEEALELVVRQVIKAADAHSAVINLLDQEGHLESHLGMGADGEPQENISPPRSSGTTMSVYRTGVPLIASDLEEEDPLLHPSLRNKGIKAFIGLPLRTRERCTGVLFVRYTESHSFSEEEVQALSLFANQAAVALENARLYHAEQLARERADALREISRVVGSTLELDEVLSLVLRQAKRVLTYDSASILLFADDQPAMAAVIGYEDEEMVKTEVALRLGDSPILQDMARDRQPILIADAREDERWIWVPGAESVRAWLGVPLLVRGEMIGVLMVDSTQPGLYTAADVAIAQSLAGQVAVAIDNARLYTSLEQEKARLELLYRLGRQLSESLDVRDVAQRALDELCTVVGAMRGIILVRERDRARLQLVAVSGYTAESVATLDRRMQLVVGNGLVGWVATKRSPVLVSDVLQDERWLPVSGLDDGVRSAFSVPLFSGDETIGAFSIYSDQPGFFNDDHRRLAESVAATVAVAIQNARLYEQAQHRLEILNNLNRASQALTSSLEVQKVLEQIVGLAGSVVNSDYTSVALLDEKGHLALEVEDFRGLPPLSRRLRPSGVTHQVLESGLMMVMDEISADGTLTPPPHHSNGELLRANPAIVTAGIRSAVAVPIQIKGKTLGVLFVHSRTPRAFQGQLTLLSTFANQAAVALENARLYEQAQQEIAERKRTQDALRASEEQYRLLTETARDIIIAHDMTGRITYANPAALDASGYDEEEFRQLNITAFLPPEQLPAMRARAAQRAAGDAGLHVFEVDLRTKSGRLLPVEIGSSLLLEQDRPVGVLLIARDITKRRQAQEALQRRATQLATLGEVGRQMASLLPLGPLLERIVDLIREAFSYRYVVILLVDPLAKTLELKAGAGFEVERLKPLGLKIGEEGICGWVAASGEPLLMNDVSQEPRYYALEPLPDTRSELAVPIRVQDQVVGVLDVQSTELNAFDQADLFILQTLADQAAVAIENARLFEAEREQRELSESLVEAAVAVGSTLELDEVLDHLLEQVERVVPADTCNVMLIEEDIARIARWRGYQRFGSKEFASTATFPLAEVVYLQQMIKTRKPVMISDTATYPGWVQLPSQVWLRSYLGAPIQVGGVTVGFLNVDGSRSGQFDSADARRLEAFAHHAATAIENARLFEAERRRREEAETLRELSMNIASTLDFDQIVERATHILGRTLGVEYLDFVFPDPDGEHMVPHPSMLGFILPPGGVLRFPIAHSITGRVYRTGQPVLVPDVSQDPDFRRTASSTEVRSELAVPVKVGDEVVAVLNVESRQLHKFTVEDLHFLSAVAAQLAVAMENARLFQAEREQRELSESLVEAAVAVSSTLELEEVLDRLLEQVDRVLPGDACNVMLIEEDIARVARWRGYQRFGSKKYVSTATFPLAEAANLQQMVETGKPMMISDTATYPGWVQVPAQAWLRSYLGAPIQVGRVTVGFLNVDGARPGQFDSADARRLEAFAYHAATAIENAGLYQELRLHAAQLEERVTERTAQLQAQYARLDALLRSVSDGILVTDAQGDLIQTNPIAQRWLTQTLSPMDAERLQTLIHNLARRAQERPEAILELTGLDLQLNAAPILEREAEKATAVVVAHDVSHIKALERMKSRFVTNVSHELRTPITTIKLYVALLQQKPEKWEKYLDALTQEAEHLARLVEDVLQVSRIDDGRLEIHPRPTPLNTFTELIVSKHQVLARSSKVTLSYQPAAPDPLALADPGQLTQALNNLVRNALHYTPEGGKVTVSTGTAESRGRLWATMAVADTGMGIPPEELSHIFERFFRGQQPQSLQLSGSGLGLAIVHEIVELHGGRVTVDSQVGVGSTFTIWLPLLKEQA